MSNSNWEEGWEARADGFVSKTLARGDTLVWHPSMGGDRHTNHIHLSAAQASDAFGSYKPLRTWLKTNGII
ncbi:hypothetical protein HNQ51_003118 [Inhella inkyongensis]|uniref:Uncharacterized protein n=1 Tax=Inhella inkyongensis TaxID=392593 RepID=A0A840SBE6_9BURK|nr:hypothetical protein [Inhella inkyongensis]MBB5205791.1 hypothetical protein [Inhella inkyongensis]